MCNKVVNYKVIINHITHLNCVCNLEKMVSDNRSNGVQTPQDMSHVSTVTITNASTTQFLPKKEQAIVMESIEGISDDEYIDGLEKLIPVSDISFISKISDARVCVYLSSKLLVEKLTNQKVEVKHHKLSIRPLIEKCKAVVIHVPPIIPNDYLIDVLKQKGINLVSQMKYLPATISKLDRAHIRSFNRHVFVSEESERLIPKSLQIKYENTTYSINVKLGTAIYIFCTETGKITKLCPTQSTNEPTNANDPALTSSQTPNILANSTSNQQIPIAEQKLDNTIKDLKRSHSSSSTSDVFTNQSLVSDNGEEKKISKKKKIKTVHPTIFNDSSESEHELDHSQNSEIDIK